MKTKAFLAVFAMFFAAAGFSDAQTLSQNSGINPADTYVMFDATVQGQTNLTLSQPVYNANTGTTTSAMKLGGVARHFHFEAGYDTNGGWS